MATPLKKGTFDVASRAYGKNGSTKVTGLVSPSGLGIHKGVDRNGYVITQLKSGLAVTYASTLGEARQIEGRIAKTTNWHKDVKPSRELATKLQHHIKGEKVPRKRNKKLDEYDLKAHARDKGHNLVDHEQATGYKGQKTERRYIRHNLHEKHIGYTIDARNTTKNRRIK